MKRVFKALTILFSIVLLNITIVACNGVIEEKSDIEKLKDYFLTDENKYVEINYSTKAHENYLTERQYIYKKSDNRIQYIIEYEHDIGGKSDSYQSYLIEFREDGVYSSEKKVYLTKVYPTKDSIPDLINILESSEIKEPLIKFPLKEGTSWDYGIGKYSIKKFENSIIEVDLKMEKPEEDISGYIYTYTKGAGNTDLNMYDKDGNLMNESTSKVTIKEKE